MNKELLVKVLTFLKEEPELKDLTLDEIEKRFYNFESFLIQLVEEILQDKEGDMITWWLYDPSSKLIFENDSLSSVKVNLESAEDFVNYMIESNVKD